MGFSIFRFQIRLFFIAVLLVFQGMAARPVSAGDFILEYLGENYKEDIAQTSYNPIIYHSIQVKTKAGPKMLILTGDDNRYRTWLRQFIAQGKQFIAQIPDDQDDLFISSFAYEIDVTNVHPFNLDLFRRDRERDRMAPGGQAMMEDPFGRGDPNKKRPDLKRKDEKLMQERQKAAQAKKDLANKARQNAIAKKQADQQRRQQEQLLKKRQLQQSLEQERLKAELEKQRSQREQILVELAAQRAKEEQQRREELRQRWLELKARLMENERIRNMEIDERNREIERRWQQLQLELSL